MQKDGANHSFSLKHFLSGKLMRRFQNVIRITHEYFAKPNIFFALRQTEHSQNASRETTLTVITSKNCFRENVVVMK